MRVGIRQKILLPGVIAWFALILGLNSYWFPHQSRQQTEQFNRANHQQLKTLAITLQDVLRRGDLAEIKSTLKQVLDNNTSWNGVRLVEQSSGRELVSLETAANAPANDLVQFSSPVVLADGRNFSLQVAAETDIYAAEQSTTALQINLMMLVLLVAAVGGNLYLQNKLVRGPLTRLSAAARRLANGEFDTVLPRESKDEIGDLAFTLATMTNSLRLAVESAEEEAAISREAAEVLRQSEERFARAVRGTDDGIWDWDVETGQIYFSPRWKEMLGFGEFELENTFTNWRDLVHSEDLGRFLVSWTDYLNGDTDSFELEYRIRTKSGEYKWVLCRGLSTGESGDAVLKLSGSQTDITERKNAESSLRLQAAALEAAADAIVVTDRNGLIEWLNPATANLTGCSVDELKGKNTRIFNSGKQSPEFYKHLWTTITSGRTWHGELYNIRKDGTLYLEEQSITPVRNEQGLITHYIAIKRDITEARKAQEDLSRFKTTLDQTNDSVFIFDPKTLQFSYANQGACNQFGYTAAELLELTPLDLIPARARAEFQELVEPLTEGFERYISYDTEFQKKDGAITPVEVALQYVSPPGEIPRFVAILRDISERLHMQQQLQQAQKMQAVGQLTGGIAHDFNNMLASVMGYNELAMERAEDKNDETLARYLSEIFQASQRARDLIAQMLAFSRGSGGEPPVPVQLNPLVNDVLTMLRPVIPKTIDLAVNLDADTPIVKVNVINFQQVVMNLALNAADAMEGRGQIVISMHHNEFVSETCTACHEKVKGDFVELSITDDGPGIPADVIHHLFEPFFTTKEVGKGTGMGLSVVHGIMHELGGHIVVSNSKTGGATFRLLFPTVDMDSSIFDEEPVQKAVDNDLNIASKRRSRSDTAVNPRVLIVDDEDSIAAFLGELLQHAGYEVNVETDSQRALVCFTRNPDAFDLVITDYSMPMMTGLEMIEAMHVLRPDLPVLLTTGFSEEIDEHNAASMGVQAFMRKPVQTAELLACVANLLSQNNLPELKRHA